MYAHDRSFSSACARLVWLRTIALRFAGLAYENAVTGRWHESVHVCSSHGRRVIIMTREVLRGGACRLACRLWEKPRLSGRVTRSRKSHRLLIMRAHNPETPVIIRVKIRERQLSRDVRSPKKFSHFEQYFIRPYNFPLNERMISIWRVIL